MDCATWEIVLQTNVKREISFNQFPSASGVNFAPLFTLTQKVVTAKTRQKFSQNGVDKMEKNEQNETERKPKTKPFS
ncbi:MAG: hypothetical protein Ct9H90mP16_18120 [Candidatus Poseidoniales archaeon]|nr:MAG: hypothetical protein Ct9H90mP16_18120 [Candidatus Poseidoniales archaeon]